VQLDETVVTEKSIAEFLPQIYQVAVSLYLEDVVQECSHAAMKSGLVQFLQQLQQRGDVIQQAPQKVAETFRVACHVVQNLETPFCFQ
jgi:hypothetical protein